MPIRSCLPYRSWDSPVRALDIVSPNSTSSRTVLYSPTICLSGKLIKQGLISNLDKRRRAKVALLAIERSNLILEKRFKTDSLFWSRANRQNLIGPIHFMSLILIPCSALIVGLDGNGCSQENVWSFRWQLWSGSKAKFDLTSLVSTQTRTHISLDPFSKETCRV